jgi:hypothetical protein
VSIGLADSPSAIDIPLNIQEWAGVNRRANVVSTGVLIPYGLLADADLAKIAEGIARPDRGIRHPQL